MSDRITFDANSNIIRVTGILDSTSSTGGRKTGLAFGSAGLIISTISDVEATATAYTQAGSTIEDITTLGTYAAPTALKCRFKEVDSTNHPGMYEIQFADARFSVSNAKKLYISLLGATSMVQFDGTIDLTRVNLDDAVRAGMTALPAAAADAAGGLPISDAGGLDLDANFTAMALETTLGGLVTSVGTLQIDVTAGFAAGALESTLGGLVTSVGTLQTDLTAGFGAAALETTLGGLVTSVGTLQTDVTAGFAAGALETTLGGLVTTVGVAGVGLTNVGDTSILRVTTPGNTLDVTSGGAAGIDWANIESPTTALSLSGTSIATTQVINSVSGAVGSVTAEVSADVVKVSGDATAADNLELDYDGTGYSKANSTVGTVTAVTNEVTADVTKISGDATAADNLELAADGTGYNLGAGLVVAASVTGAVGSVTGDIGAQVVRTALAAGGAAGSITLDGSASAVNNFYKDTLVHLTGGTGAGQVRVVTAYDGGTKVATVDENWATNPVGADTVFTLRPFGNLASIAASDVWSYSTRILTAATNITSDGVTVDQTKIANLDAAITTRLAPTTPGNTLDVTAGGTAGIDWGNLENPTTANSLTGTNVDDVLGDVTGSVGSVVGDVGGSVNEVVGGVGGSIGGSVQGDVDGNVVGTVGSVTGAVGSVSGDVGGDLLGSVQGNVVGSVDSVVADVGGDVIGNLQGDVQGNVDGGIVGNVGGNLAGDVNGNVAGSVLGNVDGSVASVQGDIAGNLGGDVQGNVDGSVASMLDAGASLTTIGDVRIANLDATVSSRSTYAGGAVASVTGSVGSMADAGASITALGDVRIANLDATVSTRAVEAGGNLASVKATVEGLQVLPKAEACSNFPVKLVLTGSDTPATGKTVTGKISKDGGAFAALTNAVAEIGSGAYKVNITAAELTADIVLLTFDAVGCAQRMYGIKTQA